MGTAYIESESLEVVRHPNGWAVIRGTRILTVFECRYEATALKEQIKLLPADIKAEILGNYGA